MNELANHLGKQLSFYVFLFVTTLFSISYSFADIPIPSTYPPNGNIYSWGFQTKGTTWNTSSYLPFIYNRLPFRMMLPPGVTYNSATNTFTNNSGKTFPVLLFLHGLGEVGTENGYQLRHGARNFMNAMNAGNYEGILVFPQNFTEFWGPGQQDILIGLLNQLVNKGLADPFRMSINGLSSGGHSVWTTTYFNPEYFASAVPMSAANVSTISYIPEFIHIPIWESQGGKDTRPPPGTAFALIDAIVEAGGNARLSYYEDLGHGTWDRMFTEPDFFPFFMRANKVNPHVFFNRHEFCAGDPVNIKLGVTAGFDGYEWRKDGVVISGANGNEINVTEFGTYDCRIRRNGVWSYWSPTPVVVKIKDPTITPPIQTLGLATNVIPDPNGSSNVSLTLPEGYVEYLWRKVGSTATIGTEKVLITSSAGDYIASVKELYGCSSNFSSPFTIVNANGAGAPPAPINFTGFSLSQTQVQLDWGQNPNPANNEFAFEIYRSLTSGGPYTLIKKTVPDAASFVDSGLAEDTDYFYIIRAVNGLGGSIVSPEVNVKTQVDAQPPSAPLQLVATETTASSITLGWQASSDNVGVYRYDVYRNGVKVFVSETTSATIYNLNEHESYNFYVRARDLAGNLSPASEQISATPIQNGLNYKYYEGSWTVLPDFNSLTPVKTGISSTVDRGPRNRDTNYAFYWEGKINIPVAGNYTFETNSDDGSKLYIGGYGSQYQVVDNDGSHGGRYREGTYNFPAPGRYTIVVTYFQISGGQSMAIYWKNTASGINSRQQIPTSAFNDNFVIPVNPPSEPSGLTASAISYNNISLTWIDNSNNENGFQIYRSSSNQGTFVPIGLVDANVTAFNDLTVAPNTKYYYKIKAVGQNGESDFNVGVARGLDYRYRRQDFTSLSQLESATIDKVGNSDNFDLTPRTSSTYYGFLWDGLIYAPQTGSYTFWTVSDDGSRLYIDNQLVVDNDFNNTTERQGTIPNLSQGWHQLHVAFRQRSGNSSLTVSYQGPGFNRVTIPNTAFRGDEANATSQPLPAPPSAPTNLIATATSGSEISLSFADASLDETEFYLYKATGTNTTFIKVATLPAHTGTGTVNYVDSNLFSNVTYFYKLVAKNVGGNSAYSNEANAKTLNSLPLLGNLENKIMRYGSVLEVGIAASDEDVETLTLSVQSLPSFGQLVDYGDGTGLLTFTPAIGDLGQYGNITIRVDDQNGGFTTQSFDLTVDANYFPEWQSIPDVSVDEASNIVVPVVATDLDGDPLTINAFNVPAFGQFTNNGDGTGSFSFSPLYGHFGTYLILLTATDSHGATAETTLKVTVNKVNVNFKVLVNFNSTDATNAPLPWNNLATIPAAGIQFNNLIDTDNNNTGISLQLVTDWGPQYGGYGDFGATTGNNSGVYPDNVMTSYYFMSGPDNDSKTISFSGLNSDLKYNFTFFGSRKELSNRITRYTINGQTVQLDCADNTQNTVSINGISPDINGSVTIDIAKSSTIYGYLNAMEVTAFVDSGTPPIAPSLSSVTLNPNGTVNAQWLDNSASEEGFRLYRSTSQAGPYAVVKTVGTNVSATIDNGPLTSLQTYYYYVSAYNTYGETLSNTLSVTVPNRAPSFLPVPPVVEIAENDFKTINITAIDPEADAISITSSTLPWFMFLLDNGDNTSTLFIEPFTGTKGSYNVTLYAVDSHGNNATPVDLIIQVEEVLIKSIFVNFNDTRYPVGSPWNNFGAAPTLNRTLALRDQDNAATGITLTLLDAWQGANTLGTTTGDNTGVYPDDVMRTFYYESTTSTKRIRVSGLQPEMTYNFTFFGSRAPSAGDKITNYTIGGNTESLDVNNNTANTVSINGQKSNASGEIIIQVQKSPTSPYAYLNAMVIQSYLDNGIPLSPSQFVATGQSRTSIKLTWFDNASNENNFEIYRSLSSSGPFTLRGTSPANTASFTDNGLTANTTYFYQIRSVNAEGSSSFSETAGATTLDYAIYVNFDDGRNGVAPFPWYTLNKIPVDNDVWTNLTNDSGNGTGINLTLVQNFSGSNPFGMNTGNNSGIYPDRVIESFYYNEVAVQTRIKLSGLAPSYSYNLVFFASRNGGGNRSTNYTVNGNTIILNAAYNISNTVQFTGVLPDSNGEIFIDLESAPGSVYAYLNALTIQAYSTPGHSGGGARMAANEETLSRVVTAYPNPFTDDSKLYIGIESSESQDVQVSLLAPTGAQLYAKKESIQAANNIVELDFSGNPLKNGLYLVKVVMKEKTEIVRVIKK